MPSLGCRAVLLDLDGVLVDSRRCIELVWQTWARERGLDYRPFLDIAHGRRTSETVRLAAPDLDPKVEARALDKLEEAETRGLEPGQGAAALIAALGDGRWAVVTSGNRAVATLRLRTAGLPIPRVFVTADDVRRGKPDPEPYLLAARLLGLAPSDCVVVEDSPTGLAAGKAAGMPVVAVLTTHGPDALAAADARVASLADLCVEPRTRDQDIVVTWP